MMIPASARTAQSGERNKRGGMLKERGPWEEGRRTMDPIFRPPRRSHRSVSGGPPRSIIDPPASAKSPGLERGMRFVPGLNGERERGASGRSAIEEGWG